MARGIWKGTISFGLVTIGVELYGSEAPERLDLDLLDKRDMSRVGYLKINKTTGKPIEQGDIVRGFAVAPNRYVVLSDADLKAANPKGTQTIDVVGFVPADAIPLIYYSKPYIVGPTKGSDKAYALFRDTLDQLKRIALARVVIRTRQYVAAVYPFDNALVVHLLRYQEELRTPAELGVGGAEGRARPAELSMAKKLVHEMETEWNPAEFRDEYRDDVLKLVKQREKGAKAAHEPPPVGKEPKVLDLMEALRRSVSEHGSGKRARKSASPGKRVSRSA